MSLRDVDFEIDSWRFLNNRSRAVIFFLISVLQKKYRKNLSATNLVCCIIGENLFVALLSSKFSIDKCLLAAIIEKQLVQYARVDGISQRFLI